MIKSPTLSIDDEPARAIKREAQHQWGHDPAGGLAAGDEPLGTPAAFARVEDYRYQEQPWMHDTFRFERFAGQDVLEIGVGLGTDHLQLARVGASLTGIDLTLRCVELTRRHLEQEGFEPHVHEMDAEQLAFDDDSFDAVYSFGVLHHTASAERAFREVRRVLRPGGVFVGGLYNRRSFVYGRLLLERLVRLQFTNETTLDMLSRVEYSTSSAKPYVRLFSASELAATLRGAGFDEVTIVRRHLGVGRRRRYVPRWLEDRGGRTAGWYLIHEAR